MKINLDKFRKNGVRGIGALDLLIGLVAAYFVFAFVAGRFQQFKADFHDHHDMISLAQEVVDIAEAAEIAGVDLVVEGQVEKTIDKVARGGTAQFGPCQGQYYGLPDLSDEDRRALKNFLRFEFDRLAVVRENLASL